MDDALIRNIREQRTAMFIGNTEDGNGIYSLVWEVVANALDEHLAGACRTIDVVIEHDGSVIVTDDGRGICVDAAGGVPFVQTVLTTVGDRPTFDGHAPHEHLGVGGAGLGVVNALTAWLHVHTFHAGRHYRQSFSAGRVTTALVDLGPTTRSGTCVAFLPDPAVFMHEWLGPARIVERLRELAHLLPQVTFGFEDRRAHRFHVPRGLRDLVAPPSVRDVTDVFELTGIDGAIAVDIAGGWRPFEPSRIQSYVNLERTADGGAHVSGLLRGLTAAVHAALAAENPTATVDPELVHRHVEHSLQAVVRVRLHDPRYAGPSRDRLTTPAAEVAVARVAERELSAWLVQHRAPLVAIARSIRLPAPT